MLEAAEWRDSLYQGDLLPTGKALKRAEEFLREGQEDDKSPKPNDLQIRYIKEGQMAEIKRQDEERQRHENLMQLEIEKAEANKKLVIRQKYLIGAVSAVFLVALVIWRVQLCGISL